jgi:pimeloyl-ACP methyl ester carboxylesterase
MKPLILLHGALGAPAQLQPLSLLLMSDYNVHIPAFPGHAGVTAARYRMEELVNFLEDYIEEKQLDRPYVFGYSMGGYAALSLAAKRQGLIGAIATLGTKLAWTAEGAAREIKQLNPDLIEQKIPAFAAALRDRHHPLNWKEVLQGTAELMLALGNYPILNEAAYQELNLPVLLLRGDRDNMVTTAETENAYTQLPKGQWGVLPNTAHPIEKVSVEILTTHLHQFFKMNTE